MSEVYICQDPCAELNLGHAECSFIGMSCDVLMCMRTGNIGPWLIWAYWINPLTYALKALTVSEFSAPRWQKPTPGNPSVPLGTAVLQANDLSTNTWWIGAAIGILIAYIIVGNVVLNVALRLLNGGANLFVVGKHSQKVLSMLRAWSFAC